MNLGGATFERQSLLVRLSGAALWLVIVSSAVAQEQPATRALIHANRATHPIRIDGVLDKPDWSTTETISQFRQIKPRQGEPARFDTEVRLLFNGEYLYIGAICHDSSGAVGVRTPDMKRDFDFSTTDVFGVSLDPIGDRRMAVAFQVNPFGAQRDLQVLNDTITDTDWDERWMVRTTIGRTRWTVELAIPWQALRYNATSATEWGVNFYRTARRVNEQSAWAPWPREYSPYRMSYAGRVVGLEPPPPSRNLRVQPYVVTKNERGNGGSTLNPQIGGDAKWAITSNTALDLTINTDFAQPDVDRQVINLSRFSVFFPERRQFFLENASLFRVGWDRTIEPFFSRRIGLDANAAPAAIDAGIRFTSRSTANNFGGLVIHQRATGAAPASLFSIGRFSRNLGANGHTGVLIANRWGSEGGNSKRLTNTVVATDAFFRPKESLAIGGMVSGSLTEGTSGDGLAAFGFVQYRPGWFFTRARAGVVTRGYHADTGFVIDKDLMVVTSLSYFDWRPIWKPAFIRTFEPDFSFEVYHTVSTGAFSQGRLATFPVFIVFQNGSSFWAGAEYHWLNLSSPFSPLGVTIAPGPYRYARAAFSLSSDPSSALSASISGDTGGYFNGRLTSLKVTGKAQPTPHVGFSVQYSANVADGLGALNETKVTHLVAPEARLALNPRLQLVAFYQYNSVLKQGAWNARLAWEIAPLSYLFFVLNDSRPTGSGAVGQSLQQAVFKLPYFFSV